MSHDTTTRRVWGVTLETIVRRILRSFDSASPRVLEEGATWYSEQHDLALSLTGYDNGSGRAVTLEQAAAVIAALSPRTKWTRNVEGAIALVKEGPRAAERIIFLRRNVETARQALLYGFDALGGPKTRAFAMNIAGDTEAVTVDVWACRVAGVDEDLLTRKGAYDAIAHAYRLAARRRGVNPSTMQATTWTVERGSSS